MNNSTPSHSRVDDSGEAKLTPLGGCNVLFAMAAEAEYGPHLKQRFAPFMTGVGPVEAAVELTAALAALAQRGQLPDLVVSLGSAGSLALEQTEIYQATSIAYRDMDASPLGFEKGTTPFLDLPAILPLTLRIPGIREATLSTGANIVSGEAYAAIAAYIFNEHKGTCNFAYSSVFFRHRRPPLSLCLSVAQKVLSVSRCIRFRPYLLQHI